MVILLQIGLLSAHSASVVKLLCLHLCSLGSFHLFQLLACFLGCFHLILLLFRPETVQEGLVILVDEEGLAVLVDLTLNG